MTLEFHKYQGTGNDFIMVDDRDEHFNPPKNIIEKLCDRRFGIGADGLILIRNHQELDFEMIYFNSDGSQSMCGNGSRCAVHFAHQLGIIGRQTIFQSTDGLHEATIEEDIISLSMHDVGGINTLNPNECFLNTGSPHHIIFSPDNHSVDIIKEGRTIRYADTYQPGGTNVNFVTLLGSNEINVRTYERGVEDETLSCGTGVTAAALAVSQQNISSPVIVHTKGGTLSVSFVRNEKGFTQIKLIGPATPVFKGAIDLSTLE